MSDTDPKIGPTPFSAEWIDDPPPPVRPRRVNLRRAALPPALPAWLPSERILTAVLVLVIVLATAAFSSGAPVSRELSAPPVTAGAGLAPAVPAAASTGADVAVVSPAGDAALSGTDVAVAGTASDPPDGVVGAGVVGAGASPPGDAAAVTASEPAAAASGALADTATGPLVADESGFLRDADGDLFPANRIVAFYGCPINNQLGVLGEDTIDNTYARLMDQVAEWQAVDPDTNVIPSWEVIATVAQGTPQSDGTWLHDLDFEDDIQPYIDFADAHGMLTFLDVQVGARGVQGEVERLRPLLEQPNVMLAIDPEFAVHGPDDVPGETYGYVTADDLNWAQQYLADLAADAGIPQKVLMVHQFRYDMIQDKETIQAVPGVELVLHADGHGAPELKEQTYGVVISDWVGRIAFRAGFKVFYNKDDPDRNAYTDIPNMTPEEILQLDPIPYYISYQ